MRLKGYPPGPATAPPAEQFFHRTWIPNPHSQSRDYGHEPALGKGCSAMDVCTLAQGDGIVCETLCIMNIDLCSSG